jgi:hypothetical protein
MLAARMPGSLAERATKRIAVAAIAVAIPLHLYVDPAAGLLLRIIAVFAVGAAFGLARRWPEQTVIGITALAVLMPAGLAVITHVAALNVFYTVALGALFAALLPGLRFDGWTLPLSWRLPLGVWALTLSLAWPVIIVREAGLRLGSLRDTGALDSWAMLTTPQVESWILYVVITQLVGVLWLDWIYAARRPPTGLWLGSTAASVVAIYQGTVNMGFLSGGPWPGLRRAAGTLLDANAYGATAAIGGPLAFVCVPYLPIRYQRPAQAVALALNWAGAWMSGSRTALLCGVFGTLMLMYQLVRADRRNDATARDTSSLLAGVVAIVLVLIVGAGAVGPARRIVEARGVASARDLWSRGGYGTVAVRMIRDYPLTGVGVGSYNWMAPDYWRAMAHDKLPFDNAQNWWRHQVAELGFVASLPILAWSLMIAWLVATRRSPRGDRVEAEALRGLLIGIGVASLLGMPTQNPIVLLMFFAVVARFELLTAAPHADVVAAGIANPEPRIPNPESRPPRWAWAVGIAIAVGYAGAHVVLARGPLKPLERAERTSRDYIVGTYPAERGPGGYFRWTKKHSGWALNAPTSHVVVTYHVEHPDLETRPVKLRITTPCETLVDEFRTDTSENSRAFELPEGQSRLVFDTDVSRTWQPSGGSEGDRRQLGAAIRADFVGNEGVVASQDHWIPLKRCEP